MGSLFLSSLFSVPSDQCLCSRTCLSSLFSVHLISVCVPGPVYLHCSLSIWSVSVFQDLSIFTVPCPSDQCLCSRTSLSSLFSVPYDQCLCSRTSLSSLFSVHLISVCVPGPVYLHCSLSHLISVCVPGPVYLHCSLSHLISVCVPGPVYLHCSLSHLISVCVPGPVYLHCSLSSWSVSVFLDPSIFIVLCPIWSVSVFQDPSPPVGSGTPAFRLGSRIDQHRHRGVVKVHWRVPWVGGLFSWVVATFTL